MSGTEIAYGAGQGLPGGGRTHLTCRYTRWYYSTRFWSPVWCITLSVLQVMSTLPVLSAAVDNVQV
eukprot:114510-Rhodomonas_salina.2